MNRLIPSFIAALLISLVAIPASADGIKIGFVDGQRVLKEFPPSPRTKKKIEEFKQRDQDIQRMAKQIEDGQENLQKNAPTMSESQRQAEDQRLSDLNRTFQRRRRELQEDYSQWQNEELVALTERTNRVVRQIAEAEKFDLIIQEAIYKSPRIDITDRVIKALGEGAK